MKPLSDRGGTQELEELNSLVQENLTLMVLIVQTVSIPLTAHAIKNTT